MSLIDSTEERKADRIASAEWLFGREADKLLRTCIHEYAHEAVALHFGATCSVRIWNAETGIEGHRGYGGHCAIYWLRSKRRSAVRLVGLAGMVAEAIVDCPEINVHDLADYYQERFCDMSESDSRLAGRVTRRDLRECLALVRQLWPRIQENAQREIALWAKDPPTWTGPYS
jgi:hypothetical protein